jgi:hypothetical protein
LGAAGIHQSCSFLDLEFGSDWYTHHLPNCRSTMQNVCAT